MDLQLDRARLRLIYFDIRGRGELLRLILSAAEKEFDDQRVASAEWPQLKPQMPFHQLPVLEVTPPGGQKIMLTESGAISRLLARVFGFYSENPAEIYLIERMNSLTTSLLEDIYSLNLKDADNLKKIVAAEHLREYLDAIDTALKQREGTFIVGNRVTLADLQVLVLIDTMDVFLKNMQHECKDKLAQIKEAVLKTKPGVAKYLRNRPFTAI